ncbi:class I SAM-dependent methyltransferase [Microlunatus flavus]|uniref:SAM-dependent methyltransferase n=1 Tax=Microlunatus flavus TaxID=1036181 RepID=A0A1H9GC72_9ACTN|nr:class I SAM-dependent methyltransferase [Microlunatus flavus]SEQ47680.1 SAM-dependent methyltransferase [Microlunatus flavus]
MTQPEAFFEPGFAEGRAQLHTAEGDVWELPLPRWAADAGPGDQRLLSRCRGTTLDVGCGPGRMTAALSGRGVRALGVDVSPSAVAMARSRGAVALNRDVFSLDRGAQRWRHVLLVDGNVGIGGDPVRLLWLCRRLLVPGGTVLVDLAPPGHGLRVTTARLVGAGAPGAWFAWAVLGLDALAVVAAAAGLRVAETWLVEDENRWQAELVHADSWPAPVAGAAA